MAVAVRAAVAAAGFGEPEAPYAVSTPAVLSLPGARYYVGEVDGRPVTTSFGLVVDGCVAIYGVATLPGWRRRGFGRAVTARAAADGFAAGARFAWLTASETGASVYAALGFAPVDRWDFWESA